MKKKYLLYAFTIIILAFTIISFFLEDKVFSDLENRNLKTSVKFTFDRFISGEFQSDYETYINDQFPLRDKWISLKAIGETALAKVENNNIILGKSGKLFEKFNSYDSERLDKNIEAVNILGEKYKDKVTVMIAPNSYEIYKEYLPKGTSLVKQEELIYNIYSRLTNTENLDVYQELLHHKDEYIYYNTDHHWTTYGAYLAYCQFIKAQGIDPVNLGSLSKVDLKGFYGTYFSKAKPINIKSDILTYYEFDNRTLQLSEEDIYDSLYDYSKVELRDKYSVFLRGNNPITIIKNNNLSNGKKLLVIKDSYANSLVPFLTEDYEEIHVIDLRSYAPRLSNYIDENNFDDIFILYNLKNFVTDNYVVKCKF